MTDEISKKTVAVLLVVAIIISIVGTWVVLNAGPSFKADSFGKSAGQIFIGVDEYPPEPSVSSGTIKIGIKKS